MKPVKKTTYHSDIVQMRLEAKGLRTKTEYMYFSCVGDSGKTTTWEVRNIRSGDLLGTVKWYGPWRQYCFFTVPDVIFNKGCLQDIHSFVSCLMDLR